MYPFAPVSNIFMLKGVTIDPLINRSDVILLPSGMTCNLLIDKYSAPLREILSTTVVYRHDYCLTILLSIAFFRLNK
jgi:hypothetical protein